MAEMPTLGDDLDQEFEVLYVGHEYAVGLCLGGSCKSTVTSC